MIQRSDMAGRRRAVAVACIVVGLLVGACGPASPTSPSAPAASPSTVAPATVAPTTAAVPTATPTSAVTASPFVAPTGPPSFRLTVEGDANVKGSWGTSYGINCNNPTFDADDILFFAQSPDAKAVVLITLNPGSIDVSERAGAGSTYTDREFHGTGVGAFDAARGATFDSDVSIVPTPGSKPGILGTITHVSGSIDCGGQTPGSSTIVASGSSPEGAVEGSFSSVRVGCKSSAEDPVLVTVVGVIRTAAPPVALTMALPANHNGTIFLISKSPNKQHSYTIDPAGTMTISKTGAHLDADYVEVVAAGSTDPPHKIHMAGDVVCGSAGGS